MKMNRILLMVIILGAAVAVRADNITIGLASLGTSADPGQTDSMGSTIAIAPHPAWAPALPGSSWVSFGVTGDPSAPGYSVVANGTVVAFTQNDSGDNKLHFFVAQRAGSSFGLDYAGEVHDAVPEPATILMVGTGLAGLIGMARRRLRK